MHVGRRRVSKGLKALIGAIALTCGGHAMAQDGTLFDWGTDPLTGPSIIIPSFTPAPFLREVPPNGPAVTGFLATQTPVNKAVKVENNQTLGASGLGVFNAQNVKHTFVDYETASPFARFTTLRNQVAVSAATGPALVANQSFIGNFNLYPVPNDPTRPAVVVDTGGHYNVPFAASDYFASGANMANESLYPGSPDFRSVPQGNSTAPNIRSGLFTLPIVRASLTTANLPSGHQHIPYVSRFNNFGNPGFTNGTGPNGQPAFFFDASHGTAGQLLSRGDFSAMIAHYRARGVNGVHILDGGVAGYDKAQQETDANNGWHFAPFENIFNGGGAKIASIDTVVNVDGQQRTLENSGVVFSGVYSLTQDGGNGHLALLLSNLDNVSHTLDFPNKLGGKTVVASSADRTVLAGSHKLLEFTGSGTQWNLLNATPVFVDSVRDGVGVPEPTMVGGLAVLACFGLVRRRKTV